jgi:hypothetical protein
MNWFTIDKQGLAAILERRGKFFALAELISNSWDSGATRVDATLTPTEGKPYAELCVEDNGEGFADLSHANTMFARSSRAGDAEKRGRFNLGEKLVLACCRSASIDTVGGYMKFEEGGEVRRGKTARERGTTFRAEIRMTRDELADVCQSMKRLLPPVSTWFNGSEIYRPDSIARFSVKLPTEIADADGLLRRTVRQANVEVYPDETGTGEILELGIPVVETENGYRVNVLQKIPLNMDRDNVTPAFLRAIQAALLNNIHEHLTPEAAVSPWAQEAAGDARATPEAVKAIRVKRFGDRVVVATPGDPLANAQAEAAGYTVLPSGAMSADAWANIRKYDPLLSTAKVFPTLTPEQRAGLADASKGKCPLCGK